jgi:hypothetical protein
MSRLTMEDSGQDFERAADEIAHDLAEGGADGYALREQMTGAVKSVCGTPQAASMLATLVAEQLGVLLHAEGPEPFLTVKVQALCGDLTVSVDEGALSPAERGTVDNMEFGLPTYEALETSLGRWLCLRLSQLGSAQARYWRQQLGLTGMRQTKRT